MCDSSHGELRARQANFWAPPGAALVVRGSLTVRVRTTGAEAPVAEFEIVFAGRRVAARGSDSVASALVAAGELGLRETAAGERRGVFCGMGVCQECVVVVDGVPGLRACMTPARDGMVVEPQPARPDLADVGPGPAAVLRVQQVAPAGGAPARVVRADLVVLGGGPGGLTAAAVAAEAGLGVVLVDERAQAGGQYFKQPAARTIDDPAALDPQYRAGRDLVARVRAAGVDLRAGVEVWGAVSASELLARDADGDLVLAGRALVLATGAYERAVPFPGWTLPGVMTTGAAQTLLRAYQVAPGTRVLVAGHGPLNMQVAAELLRGGARVAAFAELAHLTDPRRAPDLARMALTAPDLVRQGAGYGVRLARARTPVLHGYAIVRAEGDGRVEHATVARIDGAGRPVSGTQRGFAVDAVSVGYGFQPSNELARSLGVAHRHDPVHGGYAAVRDAVGRTSVPGVWVVGDSGGINGSRVAQSGGVLAGLDAAASLGRVLDGAAHAELRRTRAQDRRARRFQRALWRAYAAPRIVDQLATRDTIVCRCEGVSLGALQDAHAGGLRHSGAVKRLTRAGMGGCQGRYCGGPIAEIGARGTGAEREELELFAPSAPFKPMRIDDLATD